MVETMGEDARAGSVELVDNARAGSVGPMTTETDYGSCLHGCAINDGTGNQAK